MDENNVPFPADPGSTAIPTPVVAAPVLPPVPPAPSVPPPAPAQFGAPPPAPFNAPPPAPAQFNAPPPDFTAPPPTPHPSQLSAPALPAQFAPPQPAAPGTADAWAQAAASGAQPATAGTPVDGWAPEPAKKSKAGPIVVGLLVVVLAIPILAFAALSVLGSTVEESFTPIPLDGSSETATPFESDGFVVNTETPEATTTSIAVAPEPVGDRFGNLVIQPDRTWNRPSDRQLDGIPATAWSDGDDLDVITWSVDDDGTGATVEDRIAHFAQRIGAAAPEEFNVLEVGGESFTSGFFPAFDPTLDSDSMIIAHEGDGGVAFVAMLTSSNEELQAAAQQYSRALTSIRYNQGTAGATPGTFVAGETYLSPNGQASVMTSPDWQTPTVALNADAEEINTFALPNFSTTFVNAQIVIIGRRSFASTSIDLEDALRIEAANANYDVQNFNTAQGPDGETVAIANLSESAGGVEVGVLMVIHQSRTGSSTALLITPIDRLDEAALAYQEQLETVRHLG